MLFCLFTLQIRAQEKVAQICLMCMDLLKFLLEVEFFNNFGVYYLFIIHSFIRPFIFGSFRIPLLYEMMDTLCIPVSVEDITCGIFLLPACLISLVFSRSLGRFQNYVAMVIPPPMIKNGFGFLIFGQL